MRKMTIVRDKTFYKSVLSIMFPVALQQAINMGVNMLDTMMLGSFGEVALSASSLANQYYNFFVIFNLGIIGGCSVLCAQYWSAGDRERVYETFAMALRLSAGLAVLFAGITWLFPAEIMRLYSPETAVIEAGTRYLKITTFVFLLHGLGFVLAQLMRSVGQARLGLAVSIVAFFVNLGSNYVFIFGKFGAPKMGIAGAALGTLISRTAEFLLTFIYIFFIDRRLGLRVKNILKNPSSDFYRNYFHLGAPVLVSDGLLGLGSNLVSVVLGHMGAAVVAANSVCMVVERMFSVVISGVSNASSIITGSTLGRGEIEKACVQGETFYLLSIAFGAFAALMMYAVGPMTIRMYTLTPETVTVTRQLMRAYIVITFFNAVQAIMTKGVLRGGGDTKFLMIADALFLWLLSVPAGALTGLVLQWPAWAVLFCLRVDYIIKSMWCIARLRSRKWIHVADDIKVNV